MRTPRRRTARPQRVAAAALAGALALGACSGGDGGTGKVALTKSGNLDAAATARLLREGGAIRTGGEASRAGASAPVRARISYRPARAVYRFPILAEGKGYRIQVRRIADEAWLQRAPASAGGAGAPVVAVTPRGQRRWLAIPAGFLGRSGLLTAYDPALLFDALAATGTPLRRVGAEAVRGEPSVRFRAVTRPGRAVPTGAEGLEVWVSRRSGRPTRVQVAFTDGEIRYDVAPAEVPAVRAPSPDAVQPAPQPPPAPEPAGPFTTVASGEEAGVAFELSAAPATRDGRCWRVSTRVLAAPGARPAVSEPRCVAPAPLRDPEDAEVLLRVGPDAEFSMVGVVVPPGAGVEVFLVGGSSRAVPLTDPAGGFALYLGPRDPAPGYVRVTLGAVSVGCAGGDVLEVSDLIGLDAEEIEALRTFPWTCSSG
jgi:hypothetical protein